MGAVEAEMVLEDFQPREVLAVVEEEVLVALERQDTLMVLMVVIRAVREVPPLYKGQQHMPTL